MNIVRNAPLVGVIVLGSSGAGMSGYEQDNVRVTLSQEDLILIQNALNEILNGPGAIESAEFEARAGSSIAYARDLLARLTTIK